MVCKECAQEKDINIYTAFQYLNCEKSISTRTKRFFSTWNSYRMKHMNMEQTTTVIMLTTQTRISSRVHTYYIIVLICNMIELFNLFRSVFLVVRNFNFKIKRNFNIIQIWSQRSQLHTIEAWINLRSMVHSYFTYWFEIWQCDEWIYLLHIINSQRTIPGSLIDSFRT